MTRVYRAFIFALLFIVAGGSASANEKMKLGDMDPRTPVESEEESIEFLPDELMEEAVDRFYQKGLYQFDKKNYDQAESYFDRVLILDPSHAGAREKLDFLMHRLEEIDAKEKEAHKKLIDRLVSKYENQMGQQEYEAAMDTAKKLLALSPNRDEFKDKSQAAKQKLYEAAILRAKDQTAKQNYIGAIDAYKHALTYRDSEEVKSEIHRLRRKMKIQNQEKSDDLYVQGLSAYQEGNTAKAVSLCRQALRYDPNNVQAKRMLERILNKPIDTPSTEEGQ